jgi:signal transduction histidine kinase/ligand-binding sensor domain-containing protein
MRSQQSLSLLFAFLLLAMPTEGSEVTNGDPPARFEHDIVNITQLPQRTLGRVYGILRDRRGFIWFGTTDGLCRYDGVETRVFTVGTIDDPGAHVITALAQPEESTLLLGTFQGLWKLDLATERISQIEGLPRHSELRIVDFADDRRGGIWIALEKGGVYRYDIRTATVRSIDTGNQFPDSIVSRLFISSRGTTFVGTHHGLYARDTGTDRWRHYNRLSPRTASVNPDHVTSIAEDWAGRILVGTPEGVDSVDTAGRCLANVYRSAPGTNGVSALACDPAGRIWVAVAGAGLFVSDGSTFQLFVPPYGLRQSPSDDFLTSVYVDPTSNQTHVMLWAGSRTGSVERMQITRNPFHNFIRDRNLPISGPGAVLSLCEDRSGVLWLGLWGGGLQTLRRTNGRYVQAHILQYNISNPTTFPGSAVDAILEDRQGSLWIANSSGLGRIPPDRSRMERYRHRGPDSIPRNKINVVYQDRAGTIWVGTERGLSSIEPGHPGSFKDYEAFSNPFRWRGETISGFRISDIAEDRAGRMWVSTYAAGLYRFDRDGTFHRAIPPGDSADALERSIYRMVVDSGGMFWLVTEGDLLIFDPMNGTFSRSLSNPFQGAHIHDIAFDGRGCRWYSTAFGLFRYDPGTNIFHRYAERDGMTYVECFSKFTRSGDNSLLVGGVNGFSSFLPDSVERKDSAPPVVLTGFAVLGQLRPALDLARPEIVLSAAENFFSLSFAALDYTDPSRNHYAYRMKGLDTSWIDAGARSYASFTNIDPGSYTFEVKAANSSDHWNESGASIGIIVLPPYWQTWWFRLLAAAALSSLTYFAYRYRVRKLIELERLRLRIADDLHDDVGSNLSAIAITSRNLQRSPELSRTTRRKLEEITSTAVSTSEGMKDIVWFVNPGEDSLHDLFLRMKETAAVLMADHRMTMTLPVHIPDRVIAIAFKRNVFLSFKEILNNVVKHAGADRVDISLAVDEGMVILRVRDNGQGFDMSSGKAGNGLRTMKRRAELLGGACTVKSTPRGGTTVEFSASLASPSEGIDSRMSAGLKIAERMRILFR